MIKSIVGGAALASLAACNFTAPLQITGTIESTETLGGDRCLVLVRTSDGIQWEVTLPQGYVMDIHPGGDDDRSGLIGPDGGVIAPMGGRATFTLTVPVPVQSVCRWGRPVRASGAFVELP